MVDGRTQIPLADDGWPLQVYLDQTVRCDDCGLEPDLNWAWDGLPHGDGGLRMFALRVVDRLEREGWRFDGAPYCPECAANLPPRPRVHKPSGGGFVAGIVGAVLGALAGALLGILLVVALTMYEEWKAVPGRNPGGGAAMMMMVIFTVPVGLYLGATRGARFALRRYERRQAEWDEEYGADA